MLWRTLLPAVALLAVLSSSSARADDKKAEDKQGRVSATAGPTSGSTTKSAAAAAAAAPAYARYLKGFKKVPGLIDLHYKGNRLYGELSGSDYSSEFIIVISIAKGIGQGSLLGGYSWSLGDDWVWKFRKVDDRVHIIRRNVRFKARKGTPTASALANAYTDSVLFSLPVITRGPGGGDLIDLTPVFMSDLPQIGMALPGFGFSSTKSTWAAIKGFKDNMQLQVAATFAGSGRFNLDTVADSRGVTINIHYSISKLPSTGYTPRLADDRVGYFLTVVKDYSKKNDQDRFVRYINRWHLEKADASAKPSPPKKPIVFYIEKTVPFKYRPAIRAGFLEWNKAFEKLGYAYAIEVREQPKDATWDPEDINYNTFRWITSSAGFAMGPSRVNPYNGQILDADIIFDADFLSFWKQEFETMTKESVAQMTGGPLDREEMKKANFRRPHDPHHMECRLSRGMARQLAFASTALDLRADPKKLTEAQEKLIMQGLKEVTMHEVGHTLGLRHNFKGSKLHNLKDVNDPTKTRGATVGSVMDYSATNIAPHGVKQGDYFATTIGPYDYWAIEYGYKTLSGGTSGEEKALRKIASRSGEPALQYATDEDTVAFDPDPDSNRWDLGKDPIEFALLQARLVKELVPSLVKRLTKDGDDYTKVRRAFNVLLSQHGQAMFFVARYIGGLHTSRSHRSDKDAKPPISLVDTKLQRKALKILEDNVFSDKPYRFPTELYGFLASSRWSHWGVGLSLRKDFPAHQVILMWQSRILSQLLSSTTLERMHDTELKTPPETDLVTTAELIERITRAVFSEVEQVKEGKFTNRKPAITSIRRNLQRTLLRRLARLAMGDTFAPDDCQTIAYGELSALKDRIDEALTREKVKFDSYTRAHLLESAKRIEKVLDAKLELASP